MRSGHVRAAPSYPNAQLCTVLTLQIPSLREAHIIKSQQWT